jgi:hypothetical protein
MNVQRHRPRDEGLGHALLEEFAQLHNAERFYNAVTFALTGKAPEIWPHLPGFTG